MQIVVGRLGRGRIALHTFDDGGSLVATSEVADDGFAAHAARAEADRPRWVWNDTAHWYPVLLAAGVRVERCHDLRLSHAILRDSALTVPTDRPRDAWDAPIVAELTPHRQGEALFDLDIPLDSPTSTDDARETLAEFERQRERLASSADPGRLRLLLAAESAGALIAAEIHAAGLPWSATVHDRVLSDLLGDRPAPGRKPAKMEQIAEVVREALGDETVNLDSQQKLLRALGRAGIPVATTNRWELAEHDHAAIAPLIAYKKLSRLLSANGWTWLDEWVHDSRFRPDYVPGGVVTGRWATNGGGALQLPKQIRAAVVADPGWKLVVADAAQLEPRVLAGMASDLAMAEAARGTDLYAGIVDSGAVETREQAKFAMLGAMYGATTGESGRLAPRLGRVYPRAMGLVDDAARTGERGGVVSTLLGRSSPRPSPDWREVQSRATEPDATPAEERRARQSARNWGRFTRNFVVQGTAAEWALCWMAELRRRLAALDPVDDAEASSLAGPVFRAQPHLVYFLHDEIIVHAPARHADAVADAVVEAARSAGRLLFGTFPVDFPLDLAIVDSYVETA
ncbi:bifunctional 3'-5' exonuclease/DNA polymerase [Agromyces atrinae]|uniref:bifunctional 3'-5' exonuclease/DNA polymerase n=1 Tax=Agromyces atrinae TaxID=592376 RepID=UPI001F598959|nr:bifunctional 3'-5' exonuclease/DNA polymerase [Agromyces atrinae]MCI2958739.1 bifunctional 3'-5' exonuclease/DNA polymerase [Agromyces atrinae]